MLAPDLLAELAARPEDNAPDVNLALAEQGPARALLALARSPHVGAEVLAVVAARARAAVGAFEPEPDEHGHEEDAEARAEAARAELGLALDRALATHAATPARARDEVLGRHREDAFFVLAAASHPAATETAAALAARWPGRHALVERPWVALVPPGALRSETAAAGARARNGCLREAAARLAADAALLAELG
ncbi:MAG: hypothetical protein HY908_01190, partial [Myxococcales bacterium]|nr:hypothetical protein [Myxococcales bacterium]